MTNTNDNKNLNDAETTNLNDLRGAEWLAASLELGHFDDMAPAEEVTHDIMF